ncbi:histidine kinase famiy protein [Roseomonas xinghualingensis]|uniref:histidine kinase famiy protein n=1 Tax=Roseomonas xinghualingensis TaxID=2986475 RepID=UPI0021F1E903|nr:histidine kinase famiy protein [Roseomonas sp. SXEYE001]MCV4208249.1 histidine kinase famiy protein [Roseomonas sp. SXEYE001]
MNDDAYETAGPEQAPGNVLDPVQLERAPTIRAEHEGFNDTQADIFFAAVEMTRMPMIVTDPRQHDNPIVFSNQAFVRMTGYAQEELLGRNCRFLQGPDTDRETVAELRHAISTRREIAAEILNYRKNGSTFWNALFIAPVFSPSGELIYFFASQLDVSRRRDAEEALRQAQKMEALGQLTGGIAHDFNNLLQVMRGYMDLVDSGLRRPEPDMPRMRRSLGNARAAADRAATLTQQLLAFSRKQRLEGWTVSLNALVEGIREMASRTLGDGVALRLNLAPDLGPCRLDTTQTEVALLNILINARDALAGQPNGAVTIATCNHIAGAEDALMRGRLSPGCYVKISISDNGSGMPPEILSRVMEPFFTTKEEGRGTGLGLSMVYGFVRQSGGTVQIESTLGQGTTLHLYFPVAEEDTPPRAASPRASERPGTETILVVDDRPEVAELARAILEEFGYTVHIAHDGNQAMRMIAGGMPLDMLFTDLIMPGGMNGVMLAREARRQRPRIKVLLTTGYADASISHKDSFGTEFDLIHKPYSRAELARQVRIILDGPTGVG